MPDTGLKEDLTRLLWEDPHQGELDLRDAVAGWAHGLWGQACAARDDHGDRLQIDGKSTRQAAASPGRATTLFGTVTFLRTCTRPSGTLQRFTLISGILFQLFFAAGVTHLDSPVESLESLPDLLDPGQRLALRRVGADAVSAVDDEGSDVGRGIPAATVGQLIADRVARQLIAPVSAFTPDSQTQRRTRRPDAVR
ncbi:MAG: hypothetical protein OXD33_05440, partial [Rhodobacteraceae bacterium]|nr:hypothetical protein [Paracoccaceae bacterium]